MQKILFLFLTICSMSLYSQNQSDTIVVDRNGRGDYRNISDAIESIRAFDPEHIVTVYIRDGYYKEKLTVPTWLNRVNFVGESAEHTIINYDDHANIALPDGKGGKTGTFRTYTLLVQGNDITFENMSIENSALQLGQAVAMHVEGDRIVLRNCKLIGNQDTFYAGRENCRIYLENCYIEGTTDFIFGASTCWFEKCEIFCKKNSFITAASTPQNTAYGLIFNNCTIRTAEHVDKLYLGRPWRPFAMTVFMNCQLPAAIVPEGWDNWRNTENEKTARYFEYNNSGDGANNSQRANWTTILTKTQAEEITLENVFKDWKIN